ncbi:putative WD-40 repeat-containing protein [Cryptosporidium canis]|uniref:WD-40 repeat-containing protein n=1 Tax=Cryptosporidium canis TaxID=195482 RepID=A0ABQ8P5W7_9CRYT|nr:putative WD-40 repeat-containing protein [Cryptosporidium canis]KAJ1612155.1 putative WD-40 repeat-containing protein [Cryptosporidium canis]
MSICNDEYWPSGSNCEQWVPLVKISINDSNGIYGNNGSIVRGTFAMDGQAVACGTDKGGVYVHSLETGKRVYSVEKIGISASEPGGRGGLNDIKSDLSGNLLAVCFSPGIIRIYDLRIGVGYRSNPNTLVNLENTHKGACTCISLPSDWLYQPIYSGGYDGYIRGWDLRKDGYISQVLSHEAPVVSLEKSNDERVITSTSFDGKIRIWRSSNLKLLKTLSGPQGSSCVLHSTFSFNDKYLLCTGDSSSCIWKFGEEKISKADINWMVSEQIDMEHRTDYTDIKNKDHKVPFFTGFSTIWRDQVFVPRINSSATIGDAFVYCLHTAEYLYSLAPASSPSSITTSIFRHPDLHNDLIVTTSSLPESSIILWKTTKANG